MDQFQQRLAELTGGVAALRIVREMVMEGRMAPLIEIKGLGAHVAAAKRGIAELRTAASKFGEETSALNSELADLTEQIRQHRADLRFEAETLGNGGSNSASSADESQAGDVPV